jgi:CBS domain-containing protein
MKHQAVPIYAFLNQKGKKHSCYDRRGECDRIVCLEALEKKMYEKNITGTYLSPGYRGDPSVDNRPTIAPVSSVGGTGAIAPINTSISSNINALDQWRTFSDRLHERRLRNQDNPSSGGGQNQSSLANNPPKQSFSQNTPSRDQQYQKVYESDMVDLSSQGSSHDPLYMNLQRYLSLVNHPIPDEEKRAYVMGDDEEHTHPDGRLRVGDVMTRHVVCVLESTSIEQVASLCNRRGFTGVPVINSSRALIGIVTLTDILNHLFEQKSLSTYANTTGEILEQQALAILEEPVRNYMHRNVVTVSPSTPVKEACQLMIQQKIRRVVVTKGDVVKGIFSAQDAVKVLAGAELNLA